MQVTDLAILKKDEWLLPNKEDIISRYNRYCSRLDDIRNEFGSLSKFASAYTFYGIHYDEARKAWIYREWAPKANNLFLMGDFNQWNKYSHPLHRIENGNWEIVLDEAQYKDSFKHGSLIKLIVQSNQGEQERIPAYINRVVQDDYTKDFCAQIWLPEKEFDWSGDTFSVASITDPMIYECHIGMAQESEKVGSFQEFTENVLPRVKHLGYNTLQIMAIAEHPYYGSFGYHVSNFFAVSSRFGTPEELKTLIKTAHSMGIAVVMDIVHSHSVKNIREGLNQFDGSDDQYFHPGERGDHPHWDSKLFNYGKKEVLQFLLSNVKYWLEEFHFDGYRFDGVSSLMYFHHGYTDSWDRNTYFKDGVEWDAMTYLHLANHLIHEIKPAAISIAEDVSGMPGLCWPIEQGGVGFDYRLGMSIPDFWIKVLKDQQDENWSMNEFWFMLNDRHPLVKTLAYCESHDQALVGDKTIAFRLMDKEMYYGMSVSDHNDVIDRGISLHKLLRLFTISLGGQGYMSFMGNEFGHPEWIDFPREGNNWSYKYARRQWSLVDRDDLKYKYLNAFDKAIIELATKYKLLMGGYGKLINIDEGNKTIVFEKNQLIFVFNFHTNNSIPDYEFEISKPNNYAIILNSDNSKFGGFRRIDENTRYHYQERDGRYFLKIYNINRATLVFKAV